MNWEKIIRGSVIVASILAGIMIMGTMISIYGVVYTTCHEVRKIYGKDCVDSLILRLSDENSSIREKNRAIWALGQFADKRALSKLQALYTGHILQEKEPIDQVSQYELSKAIKWCQEGNITSWLHRIINN